MADYKDLIRKAIEQLPENNGAARRAVYEKARAALVGQLRGLNPPLAAREITQHRLQLEDCIRQVEQEASEAVIAGLKQNENAPPRSPARSDGNAHPGNAHAGSVHAGSSPSRPPGGSRPVAGGETTTPQPVALPRGAAGLPPQRLAAVQPKGGVALATVPAMRGSNAPALSRAQPALTARTAVAEDVSAQPETIEAIIAAADGTPAEAPAVAPEADRRRPSNVIELPEPADNAGPRQEPRFGEPRPLPAETRPVPIDARPLPGIVARAEAARGRRAAPADDVPRIEGGRRTNGEWRPAPVEPPVAVALSGVREVGSEPRGDGDPQVTIERAIATLEREARNDGDGHPADDIAVPEAPANRRRGAESLRNPVDGEAAFARTTAEPERSGGNAMTIFLLVFLVLLVLAGGGGFWAWHEGFIDFDSMFAKATQVAGTTSPAPASSPALAPAAVSPPSPASTQTNTEPAPSTPAQSSQQLSTVPAATPLAATPVPLAPVATPEEPSAQIGGAPKSEDRLSQSSDTAAPAVADLGTASGNDGAAPSSPAVPGNQSLLLEASQDGTTGAVPFSGTVSWSKGTDEMGQPTLVGKASIPARNLNVSVLIRKNSDPTLPASNLMEINFSVTPSFIGGQIAGLPGVLLKNDELVQGTPLVGASARVVGNSFLFALSSSPADEATNKDLLTSRKWMDLAVLYATGKRAIITLEKDDQAQALFNQVFDAWSKSGTAAAATAAPAAPPTASN